MYPHAVCRERERPKCTCHSCLLQVCVCVCVICVIVLVLGKGAFPLLYTLFKLFLMVTKVCALIELQQAMSSCYCRAESGLLMTFAVEQKGGTMWCC